MTALTLPPSDSDERFSARYFLTSSHMDSYAGNYLGGTPEQAPDIDALRRDPRVSVLRADDLETLAAAGPPPAYVAAGGFDPLHDEGIEDERTSSKAGVPTTL